MTPGASPSVIDLTQNHIEEPKDYLTALPPELLAHVFDYLLPSHDPDIAFYNRRQRRPRQPPLECLAATCPRLHAQIQSWAQSWLKAHASITGYKDFKDARHQKKRDFLRGKSGLFKWLKRHCVFCGTSSTRSAILSNGFRCCAKCDKEQWPEKITKTAAMREFDVHAYHLLPHRFPPPYSLGPLPRLRYGTYLSSNVFTTMFLRADVRQLAECVHGDFDAHLERRQAASAERRRRKRNCEAQAVAMSAVGGDATGTDEQLMGETGVLPPTEHGTPSNGRG